MYRIDNKFPVLPIKHLVNKDGEQTTTHKLETGNEPSVSKVHVLFYPCVLLKATSHVDTKALGMRHQSKKSFRGIFIGIPQHQKGYPIYIPSTRKSFLHMKLYLTKTNLVRYNLLNVRIQRHLKRDQKSCIFRTLHIIS